jgi:inner membrane protease ATP23
MNDVLTHELIHAYDDCRSTVDWDNLEHLACSEIRAANLSGDCFYWKENFARLKFGWKAHQQDCVKERATKSILCVRDVSENEAKQIVDKVFSTCFKDTSPFERIPP